MTLEEAAAIVLDRSSRSRAEVPDESTTYPETEDYN